jgi:hypothetical protein
MQFILNSVDEPPRILCVKRNLKILQKGQGVVEYAGALVICGLLISFLSLNTEYIASMMSSVMTAVAELVQEQI